MRTGGRMAEDDIIFDSDTLDVVNEDAHILHEATSQELNEAEIAGQINIFLRYMMDTALIEVDSSYCVKQVLYLAEQYAKGYRHSYYNISAEIYTHWEKKEERLNNLTNNVEVLNVFISEQKGLCEREGVAKGFRKLYDHVMLEIVRLTDYQKNINELNSVIIDFKKESEKTFQEHGISLDQTIAEFSNKYLETSEKLEKLNHKYLETFEELDKVEKDAKKIKKKVKSAYSQFVSILGIFAAVIIVFFGGASVFSNVLTNIHEAKWYQVGFGVSFVGLVMFDIVFMFLYILSKLLDTPISTKEESDKKGYLYRCFDKYPYLFLFNVFCLMIMVICCA